MTNSYVCQQAAQKKKKNYITITDRMWYSIILNLSIFTTIAISQYGATLHTQQFQLLIFLLNTAPNAYRKEQNFHLKKKIQWLKV